MKLRRFVPLLAGLAAVSLAAGCGSTSSPPTPSSSGSTTLSVPGAATPTPALATAIPTAATTGSLSGTWSGSYSGAFTGSFNLTWTQTGSSLSGSIDLTPGGTESLTGTVSGNTIQFGAVGSEAITYNGTVSGDSSMSGSYSVAGMGGGSWTASKTS